MSPPALVRRLPRVPSLSWDDCRLLVDSVVDYAIFMLDVDGRVATWNIGAERIKGYRADEIIGQHFSKFYLPEDIAAGKPERELEVAIRDGRVEDEGWRVRKDGTRFWANVIVAALRDASGGLRGFAKITRDVTERRAAEEQLRASEERFHHLIDAVSDYAIFLLDPTGHVATWNAGARRTKGYEASEIIGHSFERFYPEEDRKAGRPQKILDTVRRQGRYEEEGWRVRKDGTKFWANVVITALRDDHGEIAGFAKVTRDLTERRHAEETERTLFREQTARAYAEDAARRAEEANRIKDEFLATVSHELRTPLNAIVGWASILRGKTGLGADVERAIEVIDRNAKAQVKIVEDILDVSRIITGKLKIEPKPSDLCAIAQEALEVIRPTADTKDISLSIDAQDDGCSIVGDPERLQQVVWNLLSNAVKFTEPGGKVALRIHREPTSVVLDVTDTGRGIPAEFLPYVFDRFRQGDSSTTRRFGGLGLGLALVRHIVELHGGTVRVASDGPGKGATFSVVLPVRASMPAVVRRETRVSSLPPVKAPAPNAAPLAGVSVLVVEDDPDARDLLAMVLTDAGAEVMTAESAREALASIRQHRPNVLVSDIGMPDEDGYSLIRRLRELAPGEGGTIPSVALTAYTRAEDRTKALAAGFTTHIGKPVNTDDLVAAVVNLAAVSRTS